jgi:hypothetical protein
MKGAANVAGNGTAKTPKEVEPVSLSVTLPDGTTRTKLFEGKVTVAEVKVWGNSLSSHSSFLLPCPLMHTPLYSIFLYLLTPLHLLTLLIFISENRGCSSKEQVITTVTTFS